MGIKMLYRLVGRKKKINFGLKPLLITNHFFLFMEVKGTALISTRTYVKNQHPNQYNEWLNLLPTSTQAVFNGNIQPGDWYDIKTYQCTPVSALAQLFFNGDMQKAALEVGWYSAEYGLKGVYKVFLMIASPQALIRASKRIVALYYRPVTVEVEDAKKNSMLFSCTTLSGECDKLDYRIIGWCVRALELANCKGVSFEKIPARYPGMFTIQLNWE
jgi:hypothetical protein